MVPCEIELWFRRDPELRRMAQLRTEQLVERSGGRIGTSIVIDEIGYHAIPAELPIGTVTAVLDGGQSDIELIQCEKIQFFRASGQMMTLPPEDGSDQPDAATLATRSVQKSDGDPVVALFDGLPLQAHPLLSGRLKVDDPDRWEHAYPAAARRHGTAMASLILHGDLHGTEPPLQQKLYVRPIMRPVLQGLMGHEAVPDDVLVVDLVHRAVRRLFDGDGLEGPVAPKVCVINLSVGIRDRTFDQALSPLARLLDWLAWKYAVLFVVSAGNHPTRLPLLASTGDLFTVPATDLQADVIRSAAEDARFRRLLSPAEALNVLTVGATHDDGSGASPPPRHRDPYTDSRLPSLVNAQGLGFRRAIKPEILTAGGRVPVKEADATLGGNEIAIDPYLGIRAPGHLFAAPGASGTTGATVCGRGTSNSAALTSRAGALLLDVLEDLRGAPDGEMIDGVPRSLWLKALLAHGTRWGDAGGVVANALGSDSPKRRRQRMTSLLGYGAIDAERVSECTARRVTMLGGGRISEDERHVHRVPVPSALRATACVRRLMVTLAWFSPLNPRDQRWRRARLWFSMPSNPLDVKRRDADWLAVRRGTLQHEVFEGDSIMNWAGYRDLEIDVSCRADAGALDTDVAYALVVTLEVAEGLFAANLYDEIRQRLLAARQPIAVQRSI